MDEKDFWLEFDTILKRMRSKTMTKNDYFELNKLIVVYKCNIPFWKSAE